jgi:choline dehydrogenase-like flavoprotein
MNCALLGTKSSGRISLRSTNPLDPPRVQMNYLSQPEDWAMLRASLRLSRALARTMREDGYPLEDVLVPRDTDDATLDAFIRAHALTMLHYTSSCRMAPRDAVAPGVVDAALRVYGVSNLRIADASVIPDSPAGHPQAMVYAIAEKCADMILKDVV